jgi:hypothetical protein
MNLNEIIGSASTLGNTRPDFSMQRRSTNLSSDTTEIKIGEILAQVIVLVQPGLTAPNLVVLGDHEMAECLTIDTDGSNVRIGGSLPYTSGQRPQSVFKSSGSMHNTFGRRGITIGGVTIGGVSIGGTSYSSSVINGQLYVNDREVDLDRIITLIISVPDYVNIKVRNLIGAISVVGDLASELNLKGELFGAHATRVNRLVLKLDGNGRANIEMVNYNCELKLDGSSRADFGMIMGVISGKLDGSAMCTISHAQAQLDELKLDGSSTMTIAQGPLTSARLKLDGSAIFNFGGLMSGDVHVNADGSSEATFRYVDGLVTTKLDGSAQVTANGRTYRPRRW